MADRAQTASTIPAQPAAVAAQPRAPLIHIDLFRIIAYALLTVGAVVAITPFLWMVSVSLMSLGETQTGQAVTNQPFYQLFTYQEGELDIPLSEGVPSFVKETDSLGRQDLAMTGREYAGARDAYWMVGENQVLRGGVVNYITAWERANFSRYFFNSVMITFLTVVFQTLFSILAAYAFARMEFPGRDLLFGLFLTTLFIPSTIQLIPNYLTVVGLNETFNNFYASIGVTDVATRLGLRWIDGWFGLTVPFMASTFGIFLLRQFFRQVPDELFDAARIDGAGHTLFLFRVVVPISRAAIVTIILFTFLESWNALDWPILVTQSADWRPISYGLYAFRSEVNVELNLAMAGAVISLVPVLIVYFFTQKQFTVGIATTGLKG